MFPKDKIFQITREFKKAVSQKYTISDLKLFGSFARGDFDKSSDIDIMVILPQVNRKIEEDLFDMAYELELKYECVIDVIVLPQDVNPHIPIYQRVAKEGISI